jgi:gluconate 5-dehydrogenase
MYSLVVPHPSLYEGTPYFNPPGYSMAKSAVLAFTRYAASFYSPSVRANAICPGAIPNTEQESPNAVKKDDFNFQQRLVDRTLLKRVGHPDDLVGALVFLSSEASSYMTGQHIVIDGGWVIT